MDTQRYPKQRHRTTKLAATRCNRILNTCMVVIEHPVTRNENFLAVKSIRELHGRPIPSSDMRSLSLSTIHSWSKCTRTILQVPFRSIMPLQMSLQHASMRHSLRSGAGLAAAPRLCVARATPASSVFASSYAAPRLSNPYTRRLVASPFRPVVSPVRRLGGDGALVQQSQLQRGAGLHTAATWRYQTSYQTAMDCIDKQWPKNGTEQQQMRNWLAAYIVDAANPAHKSTPKNLIKTPEDGEHYWLPMTDAGE